MVCDKLLRKVYKASLDIGSMLCKLGGNRTCLMLILIWSPVEFLDVL